MIRAIITSLFLFLILSSLSAQVVVGREADGLVSGADKIYLNNQTRTFNLIKFESPLKGVDPAQASEWLKDVLMIEGGSEFELFQSSKDQIGFTHYKYQQVFDGHPIESSKVTVHSRNGGIQSISGNYEKRVALGSTSPALAASEAYGYAKKYIGGEAYRQNVEEPRLVILAVNGEFRLVYKTDVYSLKPLTRNYVFVDAITAEIVWSLDRIYTSDSEGIAHTRYSGVRTIVTDSLAPDTFMLRDYTRGSGIITQDFNGYSFLINVTDFINSDNSWNDIDQDNDAPLDAHWGAEMTYDYFLEVHNRNSYDNQGSIIQNYVDFGNEAENAFWDGVSVSYGTGEDGQNPYTTLDIVAHEISHGVTQFSADLNYYSEPGALNESFSDIFATAVEFYVLGQEGDFTMGEDLNQGATRSMAAPKLFAQPDTYQGENWEFGSDDNAGVHTNSGVSNYWFYLLSEGGSGVNDNGDAYEVEGIGLDAAVQLAYRTLTIYLTSISDFEDARELSIEAATDLFGECSQEVISTTNAWHAVGVGGSFGELSADFEISENYSCQAPFTVQFSDLSSEAESYYWDFGDGYSSIEPNPLHTYESPGTYSVSLIVQGETDCAVADTLLQDDLIVISEGSNLTAPVCIPESQHHLTTAGVTSFSIGTFSNSSEPSIAGYEDFTCSYSADFISGELYSMQVETVANEFVDVWIDLDNNGQVSEGELVYSSSAPHVSHSTNIIMPEPPLGDGYYRLRVRSSLSDLSTPCNDFEFGQVEDYRIHVIAGGLAPEVSFEASQNVVVTSSAIQFYDLSLNNPESWQWTFEGGEPSTSTGQNPVVTYNESGWHEVQLIATNQFGVDTLTVENYIVVEDYVRMCHQSETNASEGEFYDSGGPNGYYSNYESCSLLISPECAGSVTLTFDTIMIEPYSSDDIIKIYDGSSPSGTLLETIDNNEIPAPIVGESGELFIVFDSDGGNIGGGWIASWESMPQSSDGLVASFEISDSTPAVGVEVGFNNTSQGANEFYWDFGGGNYSTNENPIFAFTSPGVHEVTLTASNCEETSHTAIVDVQPFPEINIAPADTFHINVDCNQALSEVFTVFNQGLGDLTGEIEIEGVSSFPIDPLDVVLIESYLSNGSSYSNTLEIIEESLTNFEIHESNATSAAELQGDLVGRDLLVIPYLSGSWSVLEDYFAEIAPIVLDFMDSGGTVISCGNRRIHPVFGGGSFEYSFGSYNEINIEPDHPIVSDFPFVSSGNYLTGFNLTELDNIQPLIVNSSDPDITYAALQDYDNGFLVYVGHRFENTLTTSWRSVLEGAVQYCDEFRFSKWVESPLLDSEFTLNPGSAMDVNLAIEANNLGVGEYFFNLNIPTNDTVSESLSYVLHLNVSGVGSLDVADDNLVLDTVPLGIGTSEMLVVNNDGCDTLSIDLSGLSSGEFWTETESLLISPYSQDTVMVQFESPASGSYTDQLIISSDVGDTTVTVSAVALPAPNLSFSPSEVVIEEMACADSVLITFNILNEGEEELEYYLVDEPEELTLEHVKLAMDGHHEDLLDVVPNSYFFDDGYSWGSISELYLYGGNRMHTNYEGSIEYTQGEVITSDAFGDDSDYFTVKYPGLFFMSSDLNAIDYYRVSGSLDDEYNWWSQDALTMTYTNQFNEEFSAYGNRIYTSNTSNEESINHIVAMRTDESVSHTISDDSDEENHIVSGLNEVDRIYHFLFSTISDSAYVEDSTFQSAFNTLIDIISSPFNNPNLQNGQVAPGEVSTVETYINISNLNSGSHAVPVVIYSNDPSEEPDTLQITVDISDLTCATFHQEPGGDCSGQINFEDASNNNPTSWSWDFGDGSTSNLQNPSHFYESTGEYEVVLEACNDFGCSTSSQTVEIETTFGAVAPFCTPSISDFHSLVSISGFELGSYENNFYDTSYGYSDYGCSVQIPLSVGETYDVSVSVFSALGYENETYVHGWIDYNSDGYFTSEEVILFQSGSLSSEYIGSFTIPADVPLNQPLRLRVKVDTEYLGNCILSEGEVEDYSVVILPNVNEPYASFEYQTSNFCQNEVQFMDFSNFGATEWEWDFGDGSTSQNQNASHIYEAPGEYTVTFEACNSSGCESEIQQVVVEDFSAALPMDCTPNSSEDLSEYHIKKVIFEDTVINSEGSVSGYEDFSCNVQFNLIEGNSYPMTVITNNNGAYSVAAWIDYNHDGVFGSGELVFYDSNSYTDAFYSDIINVPQVANSIGIPLRMRIAAKPDPGYLMPCPENSAFMAEYEDYTVVISELQSPPIPDFSWELIEACQGSIEFSELTTNQATEWLWDFGDGNISNEQNPTHSYSAAGQYEVTLEVCNQYGCDSFSENIDVNYIGGPADPMCIPYAQNEDEHYITEVTLNSISNQSGGAPNGYQDFSCNTPIVLFAGNDYQLEVVPTYTNLNYDKQAWIDFNNDGDFYDENEYVMFVDNEYGTSISTITIPEEEVVINQPLRMRVKIDGLDEGACETVGEGEIEDYAVVILQSVPPNADFSFQTQNECQSVYQFTDLTDQANMWQWDFGDGNTSTEQNPIHEYMAGGDYTVQLIAFNDFGSDTLTADLSVLTLGIGPIDILSDPIVNEPISFSVLADGVQTIQWNFGDGNNLSTPLSTVEHIYESTGSFVVSASTNEGEVCNTSSDTLISIVETSIGGLNDQQTLKVFPNPSAGQFLVVGSAVVSLDEIKIYNTIGKQVSFTIEQLNEDELKIWLDHPVPGVYFITAHSEGELFRRRIVIER